MLETLKGAALWVAGGIVLAIIGAATYLSSQAILSGSDWLVIVTPILTGVVGVTSAHVAGQTVAAAVNTSPLAPSAVPPPQPAPAGAPPEKVI